MSNLTRRPIYQKGQKPSKVPALRNASREKECQLAIPGVCCGDPARVVGAHLRLFNVAGGGQKPDDVFLVDACDCCHAIQEDRSTWANAALGYDDILRALMKSIQHRRASGLILLAGECNL